MRKDSSMDILSFIQWINPFKLFGTAMDYLNRPKMRVYFDPGQTYRETPIFEHNGTPGFFCHIMISNDGKKLARQCRGRLIDVKYMDEHNNYVSHPSFVAPATLKWANEMDYDPKDIETGLPRRLDLCYATQAIPEVLIFFTQQLPNGNLTAFPRGNYQVKIRVDGENVRAVDGSFVVQYDGIWNKIKIQEA